MEKKTTATLVLVVLVLVLVVTGVGFLWKEIDEVKQAERKNAADLARLIMFYDKPL